LGRDFASHDTVDHSRDEYVLGDIYTNTVEGYYSIFKRSMKGVYQHRAEKHLHRYLSEFDFRYSDRVALGVNDGEHTDLAIQGAAGKRLTYRQPHQTRFQAAGPAVLTLASKAIPSRKAQNSIRQVLAHEIAPRL
jgi:hypothetical protein